MSWRSTLIPYCSSAKLATQSLVDQYGQVLMGCHLVKFIDIYVKLLSDIQTPIVGVLQSNLITDIELSSGGQIKKCFSPIKILTLSGAKNDRKVFSLNQSECFTFSGMSEVKVWLLELESKKRCEVEIHAHILHKRQ